MNTIDYVIQYYAEGSLSLDDLLVYCALSGMTQQSIDKFVNLAKHRKTQYETRVANANGNYKEANQET